MFGLPNSALIDAGLAAGLRVAAEGFADRSYEADGSLTPRSQPGAVIHDPDVVVTRAIQMVQDGTVLTVARAAARASHRHHLRAWRHPWRRRPATTIERGSEAAGIDRRPVPSPHD